tara:strand:- start:107 stop:937 length:831 start_codon:yes stop_codon:yes gene_type:complete
MSKNELNSDENIKLSVIFDYYKFCDEFHKKWYNNEFAKDSILNDGTFQMDYSPEPYFVVKNGNNPLYVLLTNPGGGMAFQHRENFDKSDYSNFQKKLIVEYTSDEFKRGGSRAYKRLQNSIVYSEDLGYNALINIETIPFHSKNLVNKNEALKAIKNSYSLTQYHTVLKNFLKDKPVLIVAGAYHGGPGSVGPEYSLSLSHLTANNWIKYQLDLAGINKDNLKMTPLQTHPDGKGKVTGAIFSDGIKHVHLFMGMNNLCSPKTSEYKKWKTALNQI